MSKVHPTAVVEDGAQIGQDVEIGPYCVVGPKVVLGDRVKLHSHVAMVLPLIPAPKAAGWKPQLAMTAF